MKLHNEFQRGIGGLRILCLMRARVLEDLFVDALVQGASIIASHHHGIDAPRHRGIEDWNRRGIDEASARSKRTWSKPFDLGTKEPPQKSAVLRGGF